jgi:tryptophan halogenase
MTNPYRIVVVGGGTAGWITAAVLARYLAPARFAVTLVESEEIGIVGVGEATIPQIQLLNAALGIDEYAMMRATQATYKLGIEFVGWGAPDSRYIHAFGQTGRQVGQVPFQHFWLRGRARGDNAPLDAYCLNAAAAHANRFARGDQVKSPMLGGLVHAFHLDASLYARFLRDYAQGRGVTRIEGRIAGAERSAETGDVTDLVIADGRRVSGDLFVDCSGFRSLLLGETLGTGFESWQQWLPCDRALAVPCASAPGLLPYTRSTARSAGWQWRIPLQHRIGNGLVYSSAHLSDEAAADQLLAHLDGAVLADPRPIRFVTGRRTAFWAHNVVGMGLAAGFMEPLESTSIHLVQSAAERLIKFMPAGRIDPADVAAYNAQTTFEWERVRDFLILHYHVNQRHEPFWRDCAGMDVPDALREKIALFNANGRITRFNDELFSEPGWLQVMAGQGLSPRGYHPLADDPSDADLGELLGLMRQAVDKLVATMPDHAAWISRHCAAAPSGTC